MKKFKCKILLFALSLLATITIPISSIASEKFSFAPPTPCKKPPTPPPSKLLNQFFPDIEGDTDPSACGVNNAPFETNVDINGDGWCDWISLGGMAPHRSGDSPPMKHFLFLGTKTGWRHFGKMKEPNRQLSLDELERVISPTTLVAALQDPLFVYSAPQSKLYVIVTWTQEDRITPQIHNFDAYFWSDDLDMLELLTPKEHVPIISFIRNNACKNPALIQSHNNWNQTLDAICRGTSSILKIPG